MTLFIQTDTGASGGSGDEVKPENASFDLIQISNNDMGDGVAAGYGEGDPDGNLVRVTYDQSTTGTVPDRLNTLVNTNFGVNGDNIDIIVLAVGSGFTLADGTDMAGNGTARAPGTGGNPTDSILVFYDVEDNFGDGVCLNAQDNGEFDLSNPTPVLLYHELSHAFRIATTGLLSLVTDDPCSDAAPEEQAAMVEENDMRVQLGERLRTTTNHCGNPGVDGSCATSCCVVATVATGSPYSAEVGALRRIRDGLLRRSEIGFDFFAHLHDDYYGFSPEVCRMMACSRDLLRMIRVYFVGPLTECLELISAYTLRRATSEQLGQQAVERMSASDVLMRLTDRELRMAEAVLDGGALAALATSEPMGELASLLDERARDSEYVRWALFEPIRIVIDTLRMVRAGATPDAIGGSLAAAFDAWAVKMPLTDVWHGLSRYAVAQELEFLGRALVRGEAARARFRTRVVAHMGGRPDIAAVFDQAWGTVPEVTP